jgi:hypothetical protein
MKLKDDTQYEWNVYYDDTMVDVFNQVFGISIYNAVDFSFIMFYDTFQTVYTKKPWFNGG